MQRNAKQTLRKRFFNANTMERKRFFNANTMECKRKWNGNFFMTATVYRFEEFL